MPPSDDVKNVLCSNSIEFLFCMCCLHADVGYCNSRAFHCHPNVYAWKIVIGPIGDTKKIDINVLMK